MARRLLPLLRPGMLVLLDRAFDGNAFLREVAATGALLVARAKSTRHPVVLSHLPDGSYLSDLDGLAVRIIEACVTVTGADGSRVRGSYRLITTLTDHRFAVLAVQLFEQVGVIDAALSLRVEPVPEQLDRTIERDVLRDGQNPRRGLFVSTICRRSLFSDAPPALARPGRGGAYARSHRARPVPGRAGPGR